MVLDETTCRPRSPLRKMWTAGEARLVKHVLTNLEVRQWDRSYTEVDRSDPFGNWVIWIPFGTGSGASEYRSYFRVINASTTDPDVCKIGVTSGGTTVSGNCGTVKINGDRADVTAVEKTLSSDGTYYVWIHSWIGASAGASAAIIVGSADDDDPPDNPNGGIAYASQLAGRVTVLDGEITSITQDYLRGGEHVELLFGDCEGGEIQVTP
ncbi:MAG: hypothetical protein BWY06_03397 [Candidatus Latescibacteria bacterium ADurb.Bin168]|nr:MAG: hypothetical protein BWY06_03397 [Candidatus Latescibacteria bacterium ADurb.Bin168]